MVHKDRSSNFVGHASELAALEEERRRCEAGELRVCVVLGQAGLGKSRLVGRFVGEGPEPVEALVGRLSRLRPAPPLSSWLAALGHEGRAPEQFAELIAEASSTRPVVVVVDDAHWADEAFWATLLTLAQEHPDSRLLVLATARPDALALNRAAAEVLSSLEQDLALRWIRLGPLERGDVAELAAARIGLETAPDALVDWLMVRAQGIPRFVAGLLDGIVEEDADPFAPALARVPDDLARWVHAEIAQFDPGPVALLELLAVIGSPVDPGDLAQIAGQPLEQVALELEQLVRTGTVVEQDHAGPLGYEIAHPLVREVVYGSLGGARRRILHQRAAGTLVDSGHAEAATLHLLRSARVGDGEAIDTLISQAREAEQHGSHAMLWTVVPTLADVLPSGDERWLELFDALSPTRRSTVTLPAPPYTRTQRGVMLRMLEQLGRAGDMQRHAALPARHGGSLTSAEVDSAPLDRHDALALCRQAGRDHESRMAAIELAKRRGCSGDIAGQEADARHILRDAEEAGDQGAIAGARYALGLALGLRGRFAEADEVLGRGVDLTASSSRSPVDAQASALLAAHDATRGHMGAARARLARAVGARAGAWMHLSGAYVAFLGGDLAAVQSHVHAAGTDVQAALRPFLDLLGVMADAEGGQLTQARARLDRAEQQHEGDDLDLFSQVRRWADATIAWAEGRLTTAVALLQRAADRCSAMGALAPAGLLAADLAEVAANAGDHPASSRAAAAAEDVACRVGAPTYQAIQQLAGAWSLLAAGRRHEASSNAWRAADGFRAVGFTMLEARARVAYASAVRGHNPTLATDALLEAVATFDARGATVRAARARALLNDARSGGERRTRGLGEPSLTRREQQIAELAATGFTARQIADRLHIGVRTVETHLARVYRKLGVASKQQLVSQRAELGLAGNL